MSLDVSIRPLEPRDIPSCEEILRGLPQWFGLPDVNAQYVRDLESLPAFVAIGQGRVVGFLALARPRGGGFCPPPRLPPGGGQTAARPGGCASGAKAGGIDSAPDAPAL